MHFNLTNKKELVRLIDELLIPSGYVRSKDNWYLDNQECIGIIGLGKSLYGGKFGLGIDLLLKELRPDLLPFPPRHLCHFRGYAVEFLLPDEESLKNALDFENNLTSDDRVAVIKNAVNNYAIPFMLPLKSKQVLAYEIRNDEDFEPYCNLDLKLALKHEGYLNDDDLNLDL